MLERERPWDGPRQFPRELGRHRRTWHGWPASYGSLELAPGGEVDSKGEATRGLLGTLGFASPRDVEGGGENAEGTKSGELPFGGSRGWATSEHLRNLKQHYGVSLLVLIFNVQHIMKGFVVNFTVVAEQFVYRSYSVPAAEMQAYSAVTSLPWALKPIIGLVSDIFPICGFNKAPYALLTSVGGTGAFLAIGLLPQGSMPKSALVVCLFLCSLQISTADVLTQGKVTAKVNEAPTPGLRTGLLTFTWSGGDVCALIAVISSGFVIHYCGARFTYLIAGVPGATFIVLALRGCYEERRVSEEQLREIRLRFWRQVEACMLSVLMLVGAVVIICSLTTTESYVVHGTVSLCVAAVVLLSFSLWLTPAIAKMNAFNFMSAVTSLSIDAASFYFFTDTEEQYPEGPHLSEFFFTTVRGAVQFGCSVLGIYTYQALSHGWTYRRWLIMATFLSAAVNILNIMMFRRINVNLGVSDEVWVIGTTALLSIVDKWRWMPRMVSICYMTPRGMEATFSALLMGCHNLGWSISANVGAMLLSCLGVSPQGARQESAQFANLWIASAWISVVPPIVVMLLCLLAPDERQDVSLVSDAPDAATEGSFWRFLRGGGRRQPKLASAFSVPRRRSSSHSQHQEQQQQP